MFNLDIKGAKRLNRKLDRMGTTAGRKVVRPAMRAALVPVVQSAKAFAPVDSGRMRQSIKAFVTNSRRDGIDGRVRTGTRRQLRIPADAKYYYPAAIEFGSRRMSARSFLRRAVTARKREALKILGAGIKAGLKKV